MAALVVAVWTAVVGSPAVAAPLDRLLQFRRLTAREGLPPAVIYCIFEDSRGFLWFGTADGVARFDGQEFRTFRPDPADPGSLANPGVLAVREDARGDLWMATEGGLDQWHRDTERFSHFRHDESDPASLSDDITQSLEIDPDGAIWVGTAGGVLNRFDPRTGKSERFRLPSSTTDGGKVTRIRAFLRDRHGVYWMGTDGAGLFRFDPRTRQFRVYVHDPHDPQTLSDDRVSAIAEDRDGSLWLGTDRGLSRLDVERRVFERHPIEFDPVNARASRTVLAVLVDHEGRLWIGTDGAGFALYDAATRHVTPHRHSPYATDTLATNTVRVVYEDRRGDLWIGHFPMGVSHFDRLAGAFEVIYGVPGEPNTLSDNHVLSFIEDPSGDLWVGTDNGGLNHWNASTRQWTSHPYSAHDTKGLSGKAAVCLLRDHRGSLWVGTWDGGLNRYEPKTGTFRRYAPEPGRPDSLGNVHVWQLAEDPEHRLWIATIGGGIDRYDPATETFVHYRHDPANPRSVNDDIVSALLVSRAGVLWAGTRNGVARWNPATDDWDRFECRSGGTLLGHWVFDLLEDRDGTLWASTEGGGLNHLDIRTGQCSSLRTAAGLPSDATRGILQDDGGGLWIGTNRGLARYDPATRRVRIFDESNGLPDGLFSPHARLRLRSGEFLFGSTRGFVRFDPRAVPADTEPPRVVLTRFEIFNEEVRPALPNSVLPRSISETRELTIPPGFPVIGFQFAAMTYRSPDRVQYRFKLEGFDTDWRMPGPEHRVTFTNLDPGSYRLRVKAANADGVWSTQEVDLALTIVPPWWRAWWLRAGALLAVLCGAVAVGWGVSTHRARRARQELELANERERAEQARRAEAALRESERQFRQVTETIGEVFWLADVSRGLIYLSPAYRRVWGRDPAAFLEAGGAWPADVHPDDAERVRAARPLQPSGEYDVEYRIVRPDGEQRWIHDRAFAIADDGGAVRRIAGIAEDVTTQKYAGEAIQRLNRELNDRVRSRTAQLLAANEELEAFAYSVSHDLRAPLRHIHGFVELLQARIASSLDEKGRHYMACISESSSRMGALIDDLLSFSRMARQRFSSATVHLESLVAQVIAEQAPESGERSICWRVGDLPDVVGDAAMLRLVFVNLISNALKFTRPRPLAEIEIGCRPDPDGGTIVFVRDNGVGFDPMYGDKLFGVFQRLHSGDEFEGTGIGLANVRRIISRHGGRVWAEGQIDRGATFYFSLPAVMMEAAEAAQPS